MHGWGEGGGGPYGHVFIRHLFLEISSWYSKMILSILVRFVEKYWELEKQSVNEGYIFEAAAEALKAEGIRLKTVEEIQQVCLSFSVTVLYILL